LTVVAVRESRDETASRRVDLAGLVTVTASLTALVLAIQQSDTLGWGSPLVIGSLAVAAVLVGLFFFVEPRRREPLIELGLFRNRTYLGANGVSFAQNVGFAALLFFLTLYLQNVLGYSPLQAGLVFLVFSAILAIVDSFAGRLAAAAGARLPMAAGMALCALAFLLLSLIRPTSGLAIVIVALLVAGVGQALAYTVSTTGGVAVAGALFKALENGRLAELLAAAGASLDASERAEIRRLLSGSAAAEAELARLAPSVAGQVDRVVREAFVYALDGAMLLCMFVSVAGVLAAFLVAERVSRSEQPVAHTPDTGTPKPEV
jgi:predicted MFS family arabinose efflux permease